MKTLRTRILIYFCPLAALTVIAIGVIVSWRLSLGFSQQAHMIKNDMTIQVNESLDSYRHMLEVFFNSIQEDVQQVIKDISNNENIINNLEQDRLKALIPVVESLSKTSGMDFVILFDMQGMHLASYPMDMDTFWLTNNFKSQDVLIKENKQFKDDAERPSITSSMVFTRLNPDFIQAVGLGQRGIPDKGALSLLSGSSIYDDFGEPIALCVVGKLLNQYHEPLEKLYEISGAVSVLYLDTIPIAYAGFTEKDANHFDPSSLHNDQESQAQIYAADKPLHRNAMVGGNTYLTTCSVIRSSKKEPIGSILVGIPQEKVNASQGAMLSYGIQTKKDVQSWIVGIGVISLLSFTFVAILIATQITKFIGRLGENLKKTMKQISSASREVAGVSSDMAEKTGEQASFIEETSSSLEEISSQTRQNAESAIHANGLMSEATLIIERANGAMTALATSMKEISEASSETSKIIQTIDEVAFQTNLLALNAAIEAARAGAAGAGFAIVADEVRNLALRAAEASKSTEELIHDTARKIQSGSDLASKTHTEFSKILTSASKIGDLVTEIASASNEQSDGITQISLAVHKIDKTTQTSVAVAEQFASVSEEMNAQVEQMTIILKELISLIGKYDQKASKTVDNGFSAKQEPMP